MAEEEDNRLDEGGAEVLGTPPPEAAVQEEEGLGYELGDTIFIIGGRLNGTRGKLYTFRPDKINILPLGLTDRIVSIPLVDGELDPELQITDMPILEKAPLHTFVGLIDVRAGQYIETFLAGGEPDGIFKVVSVDEEKDEIVVEDDAGSETTLTFEGTGIPSDVPYEVIRTREPPAVEGATKGEEEELKTGPVSRVAVEEDDALEEGQVVSREEDAEAEAAAARPAIEFALGAVLELPADEELEEVGSATRTYPDVFQRSEMLAQLIRRLPASQQRDPIKLQEIRRFVELLIILRNDVVKYGVTGDPAGKKSTSITTLAELIQRPDVTMSRKVAAIKKVLYLDHRKDEETGEFGTDDPQAGDIEEGIYGDYLYDTIRRGEALMEAAEMGGGDVQPGTAMPKFFLDMERFRQQAQQPFIFEGAGIPVEKDEEVFRREIPSTEDADLNALPQTGASVIKVKGEKIYQPLNNPPDLGQIPYAITRTLKQRWSRFLTGDSLRVVEPAEAPSYTNILVFPQSTLRDLGPIRSGSLAQDMSLGSTKPTLMDDILDELGDVEDFPTAESILNLGVKGNILGNVTIKDWLSNLNLAITGLGDAFFKLRGYGAQNIELNNEQASVLQDKIERNLAALRIFMIKQRQENQATLANLKFVPNPLLKPEDGARLQSRIESEPLLQKVLEGVREYMGDLANVDVNWFTYVFLAYPDLLLAVLGQQANTVARERLRHIRDQFIEATRKGYRLRRMLLESGEPPTPNSCEHVKRLEEIRKVAQKNANELGEVKDVTKVKLLVKLLNDFRDKTADNWVWCKKCNQHLMCAHELVQIQEYLRPAEQDTLHKEMLINFSGGVFAGKYICRVCGQGMKELEFDQSLEFDDEGRPMMGRSAMVDREAIELDELEEMLKGPAEVVEEINFGNEELNIMYRSIKKVAGLMGVNPEEADYKKMLDEFSNYHKNLPTRDEYVEANKGKKVQDYDIFYSIRYVTAAAAILLLNIQTRVPDYVIYYTTADCKNGFFGYPLEDESILHGLNCIATTVAGINDNEFPWNLTTLQRKSNLIVRRDAILPLIKTQLDSFSKTPTQQMLLQKKREYRTKLFGKVGGLKADSISTAFRPVPMIVTEEDAANAPVVPAAAAPEYAATAWIRQAHAIARSSAALNPDAPVMETTCCLHPITRPGQYWNDQRLPDLEERTAGTGLFRTASATTTFYTEAPKPLEGKVDAKDYYQVFANFCYQGDNKGLPHKLGLTLTCSDCGLNFKRNPKIPLVTDPDPKKAAEERVKEASELQAHIVSQGVVINEETFEDLINTAHLKATVIMAPLPEIPRVANTFTELIDIQPHPFDAWEGVLNATQVALSEIGDQPTLIQIAKAAEELVREVDEKEQFIRTRLGDEPFRYIQTLTKKTPRECGEALMTFLLIPFQRWLTNFNLSNIKILKSYELSKDTERDILTGLATTLRPLGDKEELTGLALRKVRKLVADLSSACKNVFPKLRGILLPGGKIMQEYMLRAYVMGIIQRFMDPHQVPEGDEELGGGAAAPANIKMLYKALAQCLTKYAVGTKVPSEEEIRLSLETRAEKERNIFRKERDGMTRDRRKVEAALKQLGMGKWAVGGSKAIRQYDADRYEAERAERAAAGIVDYPGQEAANAADGMYDMFGGAAAYEAEGERFTEEFMPGYAQGED
jgi:hypothetical protein